MSMAALASAAAGLLTSVSSGVMARRYAPESPMTPAAIAPPPRVATRLAWTWPPRVTRSFCVGANVKLLLSVMRERSGDSGGTSPSRMDSIVSFALTSKMYTPACGNGKVRPLARCQDEGALLKAVHTAVVDLGLELPLKLLPLDLFQLGKELLGVVVPLGELQAGPTRSRERIAGSERWSTKRQLLTPWSSPEALLSILIVYWSLFFVAQNLIGLLDLDKPVKSTDRQSLCRRFKRETKARSSPPVIARFESAQRCPPSACLADAISRSSSVGCRSGWSTTARERNALLISSSVASFDTPRTA